MLLALALLSAVSQGSLPMRTAGDQFAAADVVVLATLTACSTKHNELSCSASIEHVYKGTAGETATVCTDATNSEAPRLGKIVGEGMVLFLTSGADCLYVLNGYQGLARVRDGRAYPSLEPYTEGGVPLDEFERRMHIVPEKRHNVRTISFKVQVDASHTVIACEFAGSSSLRFGNDPEYPHIKFKPDDSYIADACRQIAALKILYIPRNDKGDIEPLYLPCNFDVETHAADCSSAVYQ